MSKQTACLENALKMFEYNQKIAMDSVDVGQNIAKTISEINKRAIKDYYTEQLRKAQLEETREVARQAVLDTIAQLDLSVSINGDILSEKIATLLANGVSGGRR